MIRSQADYFDGQSANSRIVDVQVQSEGLSITDDADHLIALWPLGLIRDENIPSEDATLFLSLSDTSDIRLRITDQLMVDAIRARCPKISKSRSGGVQSWAKTATASIAVLAGVAAFVWFGIPYAADPISRLIPEQALQELGKGVEKQIIAKVAKKNDPQAVICNESGAEKTLSRLIAEFSSVSGSDGNEDSEAIINSFIVVDSKYQNAFALPGGRMVIFSGLLELAEDPNAVVAVLAHEFSHVKERHPARLMVSNIGIAALFSVALGDVSGGTVFAAIGQMALGASYSREMETVADAQALQIMNELQYDMRPIIPLLTELGKKQGSGIFSELMNTHPGIEDRIAVIKQQPEQNFKPSMTKAEWAALKTICKKSV
jgi:predicted Zn-dependent protease